MSREKMITLGRIKKKKNTHKKKKPAAALTQLTGGKSLVCRRRYWARVCEAKVHVVR